METKTFGSANFTLRTTKYDYIDTAKIRGGAETGPACMTVTVGRFDHDGAPDYNDIATVQLDVVLEALKKAGYRIAKPGEKDFRFGGYEDVNGVSTYVLDVRH